MISILSLDFEKNLGSTISKTTNTLKMWPMNDTRSRQIFLLIPPVYHDSLDSIAGAGISQLSHISRASFITKITMHFSTDS